MPFGEFVHLHIKKISAVNSYLCYDSMMCLHRFFKLSSVKELLQIEDIDKVRMKCEKL